MEERTEKQLETLVSNLCKGMLYGVICHVDGYNGLYVLNGLKCEDLVWYADFWSYNPKQNDVDTLSKIDVKLVTPYLKPIDRLNDFEKYVFCRMQDNTLYNNTKTGIVFANSWLEWCRYHQIDVDDLISQGLAFDGTKLEENIYQYMDEPLLDIEIKLYDVYLKEKEENRKGNYEYSK
jgi:hypothetical protein